MKISKKLAKKYDIIFFDEFHVQDIAHAMIFESLFIHLNELSNQEKIDTLKFNYKREDYYINRACGFVSNLIFSTPAIEIINKESLFLGFNILKDTIKNENQAHLAIYH